MVIKKPKEVAKTLKFRAYVYLPTCDKWATRRHVTTGLCGRIEIYDSTDIRKSTIRKAFNGIGGMVSIIEKEYRKRALINMPVKKYR